MPRLTMETSHTLGQEEATRRLKEKFDVARRDHGAQVSDLHEEWTDHTLSFGFKSMGMKIEGTVEVRGDCVRLDTKLPMAAAIFKGMIETRVRGELGDLLA
ncbi:MAG: polyhydroxyalkanoic acid system family protein [Thermoguttaceae bacterium]